LCEVEEELNFGVERKKEKEKREKGSSGGGRGGGEMIVEGLIDGEVCK
jgi:hypothetical protein